MSSFVCSKRSGNNKNIIPVLFLIILFQFFSSGLNAGGSGCGMFPLPLAQRIRVSNLVVEAEVISSVSYWNASHTNIFTSNRLKIYKVFKGNTSYKEINLITEGGRVGLDMITHTSTLTLAPGDMGVFICTPAPGRFTSGSTAAFNAPEFIAYGSMQGFIEYHLGENTASSPFYVYQNIEQQLYSEISTLTGAINRIEKNTTLDNALHPVGNGNPTPQAIPTITSFTPTTISSGTRSLLTINGTNFGATRGTGFVEFRNANDAGATFVKAKAIDYRTWTNTQITVWVPSSSLSNGPGAGTGTFKVTNSDPSFVISSTPLTVSFAHINVEFNATGFYTEHINDNGAGGYTFQYGGSMTTNTAAKAAFNRALNNWICNTGVNWTIGPNTTADSAGATADGINIVRFDIGAELPAGVAGRTSNRLAGCIGGGVDTVWTIPEIDLVFGDIPAAGFSWQFGPAVAGGTEVDFETVAVHELGHAMELDHIIAPGAVMHYTVTNGQTSRILSAGSDIAGGNFVMTKHTAAHSACKPIANAEIPLDLHGSISISANPGTTICAGTSVTFTATSVLPAGTASYQWKKNGANVGTNSVTYTDAALTNGNTITCTRTVTGGCGDVTVSNTLTISISPAVAASVSISANPGTTICTGTSVTFTATPTNGGTTPIYQWKKNGGNVGTNSATYTDAALSNGNTITCQMTSNALCATGSPATSNTLTMVVNPNVAASVSIAANPGTTICTGTSVTFTATPTNGGTTPIYQWKKNGANVGTNSATYTDAALSNGNTITCQMTSNALCATGSPATSNTLTMVVNPNVAASVSIAANPGTTICTGTSVTFTATPTNGGTTPIYQWKKNGANVGTNSTTYTDAALSNGNTITCQMTSNALCATGNPATSNTLTMVVNPNVAASVSIAANPGTTICTGTSVTFTATPTNGGTTPIYQWKKNGGNVGTNSATYTDAALSNGNTITCQMTSNALCATGSPATSNTLTMVVNPNVAASVSIAANPGTTICTGTSVTFTATPTNGGTTPIYQWKKNGANVGTNSATYTDAALSNGNTITCQMTSNALCATGSPATSNTLTMVVNPNVAASVSIAANPGTTICSGTSVTFTATPTNGGTTPIYQWKKNGANVGTNSTTYTDAALANGNTITCQMTSNALCATGSPATSNTLTMVVNPNVAASVSIAANPGTTICSGTSVTFTATPTNGGTTPIYQWKKNGGNVGTNSATYTDAALSNGNTITCQMTSNALCATGSPATSNTLTMVVNPNVAASVSIAANPGTTICTGTSVTFTATPTNGGTTPIYQWKKNGANVGTNSITYTDAALTNGNTITCQMTSNALCATGSPATSNTLTMAVNPNVAASVSIAANPGTTICTGTSVTFTATPTNGGTTPIYQWKKNGANVGTNSTTYTDAALANGNTITCQMTSNALCATGSPATSNTLTMVVNPNVAASVSIAANPGTTICTGTSVTFTATPTNGGTTPIYQWKKNGGNVGTNSATYTDAAISNGNTITCQMTSNALCATGSPATSNTLTMNVSNCAGVTLNINAFIEGYYDTPGTMRPVLANQGVTGITSVSDTIRVQLRTAATPGIVSFSATGVLGINGLVSFSLPAGANGGSYYIVMIHRNALQTWSASPVTMSSVTSYNFTNTSSKAFGSNQVFVSTGTFAFYSGDISSQDEFIDVFDQSNIDNDASAFAFGNFNTDINGDGFVDVFDQAVADNNAALFLFSAHP